MLLSKFTQLKRIKSDLNRLYQLAKECKMREVIEPYIKVMVLNDD